MATAAKRLAPEDGIRLVIPQRLGEARLQAHYAAQLIASLGYSFLGPTDDDSHPNLSWSSQHGAFEGRRFPVPGGIAGALQLTDLTVSLRDADGDLQLATSVSGMTIDEARSELGRAVLAHADLGNRQLKPMLYELPDHELSRGAKFRDADSEPLTALAAWFDLADCALATVRTKWPASSEVRCWPHHFDLATLLSLDGEKSIGVGLSPGDSSYSEPYFYVSPWPYPDPEELPRLSAGHWYTDGFVAGVLTGTELLESSEAGRAEVLVDQFLDEAVRAGLTSLK